MARIGNWFALQTLTGRPLDAGTGSTAVTVTPISRRLVVRWPQGGFLWHFPVAVLIDPASGREQAEPVRVPVRDPTLMIWVALLACTVLALLVLTWSSVRRRTHHEIRSRKA